MSVDNSKLSPDASPAFCGIEVKRPGYTLYLLIPNNQMECRCSYLPNEEGSMLTSGELADILMQHNVVYGIDQEALEDFVVGAAAGQQLHDVLLASGTPPVNGRDACFDLSVPSTTLVKSGNDDVCRVDMYAVQTFVNVSSGEEIGRIIPDLPGTPGQNISGLPVPPLPGKPLSHDHPHSGWLEESP